MNWRDKIRHCWDQLPSFMAAHDTVRATIVSDSEEGDPTPWVSTDIDKANMITSQEQYSYGSRLHRPVLDLDFRAELIPSSTPGHFHLYLDHVLSWEQYKRVLNVMADVGLLQRGFVDCSIERGATSVRLPWIKKDDWAANQADPDGKIKQIEKEILDQEEKLRVLRLKLAYGV